MVDMPEIYVNYDLPAIIGGKIHLPELRLALKEFMVVKSAKGELNLDALKTVQAQKEGKAPVEKRAGKAPAFKIDTLMLSIGKVIYKDYSKGTTPEVKEFNVNLNERYTNVDNPYRLASLIIVKALTHTSIARLTNFDLKGLEDTVGDVVASAQKIGSAALGAAKTTITTTEEKAEETIKGLLKNPFGSNK
jgi:hypothetical protein